MIRALAPSEADIVGSVLGLARLFQGDGMYLVDWLDGEPTGHVHLAFTDPPELQDLEVRDAYRGMGIGSRLIDAVEQECRMRRCARLRVTVSADNDVARVLYANRGYGDVGIAPRRVAGTIVIRSGPIEVDDTILTWEKSLTA